MMRSLLLFILCLLLCVRVTAQDAATSNLKIFNEFAQLFRDHYAFFDLRKVNWEAQVSKYQSKIMPQTSQDELFQVFCDMIDPLEDGHTSLSGNGKRFNSGSRPSWFKNISDFRKVIQSKYLNGNSKFTGNGKIEYGQISSSIGYIAIREMDGYSPDVIDAVLEEFRTMSKIIIDVRFNGGGEDNISLGLASRFTDSKRLAYSKETFYKGTYKDQLKLFIEPVGQRPNAKIIVLAGPGSASATEMFVMAMKAIPGVTVVGENTAGIHSDILSLTLSNGWRLNLSHQKYTMPDGKVYEAIGVPPHTLVTLDATAFLAGKDNILDFAINN